MGESARSAFVPEGLNDSSQAIHCLEHVSQAARPVRDGLILNLWSINRPDRSTPIRPNHTVPYGTALFGTDTRQ
jgi:hypothetical protein